MKPTMLLALGAGLLCAAEVKLGKPLQLQQATPIATLLASPDSYTGKVIQVKGKITAVCQQAGCWMALAASDGGQSVRVKVKDGEIVFPKDGAGKTAVAEGKFTRIDLTKEQAVAYLKHQAEESGRKFDPASVTSGMTLYQLAGQGAVILD